MLLFKSAEKLHNYLNVIRKKDKNVTLGFVPTMGALHAGHLALIDACVEENTFCICSIFVNPKQFGDSKDLEKYPRPITKDIELLEQHHCAVLFLPSYEEIYPPGYTDILFDLNGLDTKIEGRKRPGHFQGVCNVLMRFFDIVRPNRAYFGQKDFQQIAVVKQLLHVINLPIEIKMLPIRREATGLAMSSRNERLSAKGRLQVAFIYQCLQEIKKDIPVLGLEQALKKGKIFLNKQSGATLEYLLAVDTEKLEEVQTLRPGRSAIVLTVVQFEGLRLLDNILI